MKKQKFIILLISFALLASIVAPAMAAEPRSSFTQRAGDAGWNCAGSADFNRCMAAEAAFNGDSSYGDYGSGSWGGGSSGSGTSGGSSGARLNGDGIPDEPIREN